MSSFEYLPYDDGTQLARQIEGYPRSFTRTPAQPLIRRPTTLSELTGPIGLERKLKIGFEDRRRPMGQLIAVEGRVTDEDGAPLANAVIEIWQANSAGKYIHELDRHEAPVDPNFTGQGRLLTDVEGRFQFRTMAVRSMTADRAASSRRQRARRRRRSIRRGATLRARAQAGADAIKIFGPLMSSVVGDTGEVFSPMGTPNTILIVGSAALIC